MEWPCGRCVWLCSVARDDFWKLGGSVFNCPLAWIRLPQQCCLYHWRDSAQQMELWRYWLRSNHMLLAMLISAQIFASTLFIPPISMKESEKNSGGMFEKLKCSCERLSIVLFWTDYGEAGYTSQPVWSDILFALFPSTRWLLNTFILKMCCLSLTT